MGGGWGGERSKRKPTIDKVSCRRSAGGAQEERRRSAGGASGHNAPLTATLTFSVKTLSSRFFDWHAKKERNLHHMRELSG